MKRRGFRFGLSSGAFNFLLVYLFFGYIILIDSDNGFDKKNKYLGEIDKIESTIIDMRREIKRDSLVLHLINNDDRYLEQYARENLNMIKKGETIYKFE